MLMSDRNDNEFRLYLAGEPFERLLARPREMQHIGALPSLTAEPLTKQLRDIGLVIHNQDADAHDAASTVVVR
jgi:hypothetical protein